MKTKTTILCTAVAGLLAATPALQAEEKQTSSATSVTTSADGTATVTIEVDGKKETRTFKLGNEPLRLKMGKGAEDAALGKPAGKTTWIGVGIGSPVTEELRTQLQLKPGEGITVSAVLPDSPAAKAGLAQHDILTRLDDQLLVTGEQFKALIKMRKPGDSVKLGYIRKGERLETQVTLGEHEAEPEQQDVFRFLEHPEKIKGSDKWQERLQGLREKSEGLRDKLKDAKERFPGVIVDKRAFILGADGTIKKIEGELGDLGAALKTFAEQLEKANIPKEEIEAIRKAVENVVGSAGEAAGKAALEALREYRLRKNSKQETPAPPAPPAPSAAPIQQ